MASKQATATGGSGGGSGGGGPVKVAAKKVVGSPRNQSGPDSTCPSDFSLLDALEKMLDLKLGKIETRVGNLESVLVEFDKKLSDEKKQREEGESKNTLQIIKLITNKFNDLNQHQTNSPIAGGFFGKNKVIPPICSSPAIPSDLVNEIHDIKEKVRVIDTKLDKQSNLSAHQTGEIKTTVKNLDTKTNEIVNILNNLDSRIGSTDESLSRLHAKFENALMPTLESLAKSPATPVPPPIDDDLKAKIGQLQTNLDFLLTGESETNALIDQVIPSLTKLQKDVESLNTNFSTENKTMKEETIPKLFQNLDDIYVKIKDTKADGREVLENSEDVLDKLSKFNKMLEDIRSKVNGIQQISRQQQGFRSGSYYRGRSRSKDRHYRCSSSQVKATDDDDDESDVRSDEGKTKSPSKKDSSTSSSSSGNLSKQLIMIHKGIENLGKEIRKVDVLDLVEERLIPNVYTIRKTLEHFINNHSQPHQLPSSTSRSMHHRDRGGRMFYNRGGPRNFYYDRYDHRTTGTGTGGTRWTYDEFGNREQPSDEEGEEVKRRSKSRSRSPRSHSRSKSRDSDSEHKKRKSHHKERSPSQDSDDGDIQNMEKQINKIATAVEEIQDKMDSWLKYSKKTLTRSDENTNNLIEKLSDTRHAVNSIKDKLVADAEDNKKDTEEIVGAISKDMCDKVVTDVHSKLCEFGSMVESLTSDLSAKFEVGRRNDDDVVVMRIDEVMQRIKKNDGYIKGIADNSLKLISIIKKLEQNDKAIISEIQATAVSRGDTILSGSGGSASADLIRILKDVQPKLDDLYIKVLPVLEEIKSNSRKGLEKDQLEKREDSLHIQKILGLVEDIKEENKANAGALAAVASKNSGPILGPNDNSLLQIFNALNELKIGISSKENNSVKNLNELRNDNIKVLGKINEVLKSLRPTEKMILKMQLNVDELRKNSTNDGKTLSQMNTVLQGLKVSSTAHESKLSTQLKELKEALPEMLEEQATDLSPVTAALEAIKEILDSNIKDTLTAIKTSTEKLGSTPRRSSDEFANLANNMGKILGCMEKKLIECSSKEAKLILTEIRKFEKTFDTKIVALESSNERHDTEIQEQGKELLRQLGFVEQGMKELKSPPPAKKAGPASSKKNSLELGGLATSAEVSEILEELSKYKNNFSEILNSVEDLKLLTSSTPNALRDIVPNIEKMNTMVMEIPNDINSAMAATEENLCANLEGRITEAHRQTIAAIFEKFDLMDSRMAVIKKYAKHGSGNVTAAANAAATATASNTEVSADLKKYFKDELTAIQSSLVQELTNISNLEEVKSGIDNLQSTLIPLVEDVRAMDKQIMQEQAKSVVVEDQLEALCNTILQPIQELRPIHESIYNTETEIKELLLLNASSSSEPGGLGSNSSNILTSAISKMEERLSSRQVQCVDLLTDIKVMIFEQEEKNKNRNEQASEDESCLIPSGSSNMESIRKLVECLKKVQGAQMDIMNKTDQSIEFQTRLNESFQRLIPNLEEIKETLNERQEMNLDSGNLPDLCADLINHVTQLGELGNELTLPRNQSVEDFKELIRLSVTFMERIIKDPSPLPPLISGTPSPAPTAAAPPSLPAAASSSSLPATILQSSGATTPSTSFIGQFQEFVSITEDGKKGTSPPSSTKRNASSAGGVASSSSSSSKKKKKMSGPKRARAHYVDGGAMSGVEDSGPEIITSTKALQPVVRIEKETIPTKLPSKTKKTRDSFESVLAAGDAPYRSPAQGSNASSTNSKKSKRTAAAAAAAAAATAAATTMNSSTSATNANKKEN